MADGDLFIHVQVEAPSVVVEKPVTGTATVKPVTGQAQPRPKGTAT